MAQNVGNVTASLDLDTRKATQSFRKFEREVNRASRNLNGLGSITQDARKFESALGAATNRVTAFAAAAVVFQTLQNSVGAFVTSVVEVDKALAKINVNLNESGAGLKKFSQDLFNIARQTGQTFDVTAKAAEELARQGLSAEETTKRLKDALMLSRIAGIDSADAVDTLTATINSFNQSALTSTEIINKFAAVDTKFAVSSKDLSEAVARVGSTAQAAGLDINQLIGLVTSLQQTTALGGANIGNGLKTIFTRITAAPETVSALEGLGVAIKDSNGNLRNGVQILQDYVKARERLSESERASTDRIVAGTFQINKLKAALGDIAREYGIYASATRTASNATDEAIRKNEQLNQTLNSLINATSLSFKQLSSAIGEGSLSPVLKSVLGAVEKIRSVLSGENGNQLGEFFGNGIIKGITSVLTGPVAIGVTAVLLNAFKKVFSTLAQDAQALFKINDASKARAIVQERINYLLSVATKEEREQYMLARGNVALQAQQLRLIQARVAAEEVLGNPLQNVFIGKNFAGRPIAKGLVKGSIPINADPIASAIAAEMKFGNVPRNSVYVDRDPRVASPANPAGLLVANTRDEPLGGYQGVNRVISSGGNPKLGSIPNFAVGPRDVTVGQRNAAAAQIYDLFGALKKAKPLGPEFNKIGSDIQDLAKKLNKFSESKVLTRLSKEFNDAYIRSRVVSDESRKATFTVIPSGTIDYSRAIIDRNKMRSQKRSAVPSNKGLLGPALPINPALAEALAEEADLRASERAAIRQAEIDSAFQKSQNRRRVKAAQLKQRKDRNFQKAQLIGVAASFAGGFIPEGKGGTIEGIGFGAASGAAYGAGVGGIFGPKGFLAGAAIGGLIGAFSKLKKSAEELNAAIDESTSQRSKEKDTIDQVLSLREQLQEANKEGADTATISRIQTALKDAEKRLTVRGSTIVNEPDAKKRSQAILKDEEQRKLQDVKAEIEKTINLGKTPTSQMFREAFPSDFNISSEQAKNLTGAIGKDFSIPELKFFGGQLGGTTNIKEVTEAQKKYADTLKQLTPLFEKFVDVSKITPQNIAAFAEAILKASQEAKNISKASEQAAGVIKKTLGSKSFLSLPNQEAFQRGGMALRFPRQGTQEERDRATFESLKALAEESPDEVKKNITESQQYKQLAAKNQLSNLSRTAMSALGIQGNFSDARGINVKAVQGRVNSLAEQGNSMAKYFKDLFERGMTTANKAGLYKPETTFGYTGSKSGLLTSKSGKFLNSNVVGLLENEEWAYFNSSPEDIKMAETLAAKRNKLAQGTKDFNARLEAAREKDSKRQYITGKKSNGPPQGIEDVPETKNTNANIKVGVDVSGLVKIVSDAFDASKIQTAIDIAVKNEIEKWIVPLKADLQANRVLPPEPPKLNNFNRTY